VSSTSAPAAEPRGRSRATSIAALLTVLLVAAAAQCRPSTGPTVKEYRDKSATLASADKERRLRIGVQASAPLVSEYDAATDKWAGFDVEIARYLAYQLGFTEPENLQFVPLTTEERISALQAGEVHLVVADFTITDERRKFVRFAGPYFVSTPEIMIRKSDVGKIKTIDDLKRVNVCTTGGSTSAQVLSKHGVTHSLRTEGAECADGLLSQQFDAHCTDEVVIAGWVHRQPNELALVNMPFADTEPLGVGIPLNDPYLEGLIAHYLSKQLALGSKSQWQIAYNDTLGRALGPKTQPPLLPGYPTLVDHDA
jgi:glutamate transport system substrate-binding protein